jgi:hypothetical protein
MQIIYTPETPPTRGNAKKIWKVLTTSGLQPTDLHYNFGSLSVYGSGTWACKLGNFKNIDPGSGIINGEYWCGLSANIVYIKDMVAPFTCIVIGYTTQKCPFRTKTACRYPSMVGKMPGGCPKNRDCIISDQMLLYTRNNEFASV